MSTTTDLQTPALDAWVRLLRGHAALVRDLNARLIREHDLTLIAIRLELENAFERQLARVAPLPEPPPAEATAVGAWLADLALIRKLFRGAVSSGLMAVPHITRCSQKGGTSRCNSLVPKRARLELPLPENSGRRTP